MDEIADPSALRERLRATLDGARQEFHEMADSLSERAWTGPSHNPGWTNGQVLFHVLLGFLLVPTLASLLVFFGRLPSVFSRVFAGILNVSTPLFNRINASGPRFAARVLGRAGVIRRFDQVHAAILARLDRIHPRDWSLTMRYPIRWDPASAPTCDWKICSDTPSITCGIIAPSCGKSRTTEEGELRLAAADCRIQLLVTSCRQPAE